MVKNYFKYYCWLAVLIIIIYWPVSTFLFAMKNDALAGYFPAKYFIAESIHNNIIPWWNPYINYGYPMHADLTSSFWSPFTWIFSLLGGYTVYTVHLEYLLYCILAAWGMFSLSARLKQNSKAAFVIALCYACGGIFTGNAQHTNWICGAAILPFVLSAYLNIIEEPRFKNAVSLALWTALFIVSAHPYLIISLFYITLILFFVLSDKSAAVFQKTIIQLVFSVLLILLLTSGYLFSALELFPYLSRSQSLSAAQVSNHFPIVSVISALLPFTSVSPGELFQHTDLGMRNAYMGIVILIFFIATLVSKKNYYQKIFLTAAACFFILSFGGIISRFLTHYIPLLGFVRLISVFRLPGIFFLLLACGYSLSDFFEGKLTIKINKIITGLLIFIGLLFSYSVFSLLKSHDSLLPVSFDKRGIKDWIENISLSKTIVIQSVIQIPLLLVLLRTKTQHKFTLISVVCFIDLFLAVSLNAPFTIVGQKSVKATQELLNTAPKGFPLPELKPIIKNTTADPAFEKSFGNWSMYSKEIGTLTKAKTYPNLFKSNQQYFSSGLNNISIHSSFLYKAQQIIFYSDSIQASAKDSFTCFVNMHYRTNDFPPGSAPDSSSSIKLIKVEPNQISIESASKDDYVLVIKQNYYKYWEATVDGNKTNLIPCNYAFMCVPVSKGEHSINLSYEPGIIKKLGLLNMVVLLLLFVYKINTALKRKTI